MVSKIHWDDVVLICSCGEVVKLQHLPQREKNHIVLCNGDVFSGRARFYPQFRKSRREYEVRVPRDWEKLHGTDRYMLYHVGEEISELLYLMRSLQIGLTDAALVFNGLRDTPPIGSFVAFRRDYPDIGMAEAVESWKLITEVEFGLLNVS